MALQHDEQGFLVGPREQSDQLISQLNLILAELKAISASLSTPPDPAQSAEGAPVTTGSVAPVVLVPSRDSGGRVPASPAAITAARTEPPMPAISTPPDPAQSAEGAPVTTGSVAPVVLVPSRSTPRRDANGRFVSGGQRGKAGETGVSGESDSLGNMHLAVALGDMGERISGAVAELAVSEEADPTVKAFNEVTQPLSRGFAKIMGSDSRQGDDRWFRRIWRTLKGSDEGRKKADRQTIALLEDIEEQQGSKRGGGWLSAALAPVLALLGKMLHALLPMAILRRLPGWLTGGARPAGGEPGRLSRIARGAGRFAKRIPVLGSLLGLGLMAGDVYDTERGEGSRAQKDVATGAAVGRGAGALGGAVAGGAVGGALGSIVPVVGNIVGGIVGAAVGAWLGESAGEIIGTQFGSWVSDLRNSGFVQGMADAWRTTTLFVGHLWGQVSGAVSAQWSAVSAAVGSAWDGASATASAAWAATAQATTAMWDSVSSTLTGKWDSAVNTMSSAWEGVTGKLSAWWDSVSDMGGKANGWLKDATGIDAKAKLGAASEAVKSFAGSAWGRTKSGVAGAASYLGEATGVSKVYRAVSRSASYAKNRSALEKQMATAGIVDPTEQAMFMAQMDHESGGMTNLEESFKYKSADQVMANSASARKHGSEAVKAALAQGPKAVAELMYGGRMGNKEPGDAHKFRGRGFTQLTGRDNYEAASRDLGLDLVGNPDMAAEPEVAAKVATWYWQQRAGLSDAAKRGDVEAVTRKVNGGTNGLADRKAKSEQYLAEYRDSPIPPPGGVPPTLDARANESRASNVALASKDSNPSPSVIAGLSTAAAHQAQPTTPVTAAAEATSEGRSYSRMVAPAATSIEVARVPVVATAMTVPPAPPAVAAAPNIAMTMQQGRTGKIGGGQAPREVSRDLPDRQIAHIVTGAYSGAV